MSDGWGLPLEQSYSAMGQLKEGSVSNHDACVLEVGSHPDSLCPHSGILAIRAIALQGILGHQVGGGGSPWWSLSLGFMCPAQASN